MKNYLIIAIGFMMMACSRPASITMNFEGLTNPEVHFQYELDDSTCVDIIKVENATLHTEIALSEPSLVMITPQQYVDKNSGFIFTSLWLRNIKPGDDITLNVKCKDKYMYVDVEGSELYKEYFGVMNRIASLKSKKDSLLLVMLKYSNERNITAFMEVADQQKELEEELDQIVKDYIQANPSSEVSVELFASLSSEKQKDECYELIDKSLFKGVYAKVEEFYLDTKATLEKVRAEMKAEIEAKAAATEMDLVGQEAANIILKNISGQKFNLHSLRGKWVVLDFWATWCAPCRASMPHLKEFYKKYDGKFEVVGICCASQEENWRKMVEEMELKWINVFNYPSVEDNMISATSLYKVDAFPTYFIINPEGKIHKVFVGAKKELYDELDEILK